MDKKGDGRGLAGTDEKGMAMGRFDNFTDEKLLEERGEFQAKIDGPENDERLTANSSHDLDYWLDTVEEIDTELSKRGKTANAGVGGFFEGSWVPGQQLPRWYYGPRVDTGEEVREPHPGEKAEFFGVYERVVSDDPTDNGHAFSEWRADFAKEDDARAFVESQNNEQGKCMPVVIVGMGGGLPQWVIADSPVEVINMDMDTEGSGEDEVRNVMDVNGSLMTIMANSGEINTEVNPCWVARMKVALCEGTEEPLPVACRPRG